MLTRRRPRVLIIEDDELVRVSVEAAFVQEGYTVRAEADGTNAERLLDDFSPDLAILDVNLPVGPDGYTVARRLRAVSRIPIVFLTSAGEVEDRLAGFEAGGDDYVAKPFSVAELLARARALLLRSGHVTSAVWQVGDLIVDESRRKVTRGGHRIDVTPTEYQLLSVLVANTGKVVSREQLVVSVWGSDPVESNSVNVHMSSLRRKLETHGPAVIHTVRGMGYVLRG